jgi:hypothetical protein
MKCKCTFLTNFFISFYFMTKLATLLLSFLSFMDSFNRNDPLVYWHVCKQVLNTPYIKCTTHKLVIG